MKIAKFAQQISFSPRLWQRVEGLYLLYAVGVMLLSAFCFLYELGAYPIRDINEGLYVEVAREMLSAGDWIVPHLLGVPYIEKPPLLYWLMALSFSAFGATAESARLVSAIPMTFLSLCMFLFCVRIGYFRAALYASLILSTSLPVLVLSRTVLFDPLLTALLSGCFLTFMLWYPTLWRGWLWLSALLLAFATLAKGGLAIALAIGVIGLFFLFIGDRTTPRKIADPIAIALFIAVALPWHIIAVLKQGGFAWFYFVNEHILRFIGLREPHDYQSGPLYYYFPRLLVLLFPWTPLVAVLMQSPRREDRRLIVVMNFCKAWILFPLLFFSLSEAKGQYYILVLAPPCALLIGLELERRLRSGADCLVTYSLAICPAICIAAITVVLNPDLNRWMHWGGIILIIIGIFASSTVCLICVSLFAKLRCEWVCSGLMMSVGLLSGALLSGVLEIAETRSLHSSSLALANTIEKHSYSNKIKVFVYRDFEDVFASLPFYLQSNVKVIDSVSKDLQFGCNANLLLNGNACISARDFKNYCERHSSIAVVSNERINAFRSEFGRCFRRVETVGEKSILFTY